MKTLKIFSDADGVLVDFELGVWRVKQAMRMASKETGKGYKELTSDEVKKFIPSEVPDRATLTALMTELGNKYLWSTVGKYGDNFWTDLEWMPDGKVLWNFIKPYNPSILTGVSMDKRCAPEKKIWFARETGDHVDVITCMARDKVPEALKRVKNLSDALLIDDKEKNVDAWLSKGGPAILHKNAKDTIEQLRMYGFE